MSDGTLMTINMENYSEEEFLVAEIDFYDYGSEAKSVFTLLDKENSSGISFNLIRNVGEISEIYTLELNLITNNEVVNKATMFAEFENSNKANEMAIKCGITYTDKIIELSVNADTKVKFTDVEVEDLTSENCLFIDELNEEEKRVNIKAIKDRTAQIFNEKVEKIFLINTNVNSSIIEGIDSDEEIEAALKQAAQEKLINAVANEMYLAQEEGETYTVEDIADLEIEDVELEIVVENEIATVKIDGFTFQIDASFALSEVTTETE